MSKRLCPVCQKKRSPHLFLPRHQMCELCKIAKRNGIKKEKKESSQKTWLKRCDAVVGAKVRARSGCESPRLHVCKGVYQWCHGISRSYHTTRHMEKNGFRMCQAEHYYFTNHPLEWEAFLEKKWGNEGLAFMKRLALSGDKIDYKQLYEELCQT